LLINSFLYFWHWYCKYIIKINIIKKIILSFVALSFTFGVYSQTIVEAAVSNKDFSTLVTDVAVTNGVIHVISSVVMPK